MANTDRIIKRDRNKRKGGAKILPFRREFNLNIGFIIFVFIFLYLAVSLVRSATRENYSSFTVGQAEALSGTRQYQALILRQEKTVNSRFAGYVDIFAPEGSHVSTGAIVSSVDEIGTFSQSIKAGTDQSNLGPEELGIFQEKLRTLATRFNSNRFSSVYESKNAINSFFTSRVSRSSLDALEENASLNEFFHIYKSETGGLVLYYRDGYENKNPLQLSAGDFSGSSYKREAAESLVASGDFLYKLVDSENWSLVLPLTAEEAGLYAPESRIRFTFLKNGLSALGQASILNGSDGTYLLKLDLSRYMIQFARDRFAEIRIESIGEKGYKIPKSSLVTETAFLVPREYEISGSDGKSGFLQETKLGSAATVQFVSPDVLMRDDTYCYISHASLSAESVLIKPESQDRYTVRLSGALSGVYRINAGFTEFAPVEIIEESSEYYLVRRGTPLGIETHDKLLLNAGKYRLGQLLH